MTSVQIEDFATNYTPSIEFRYGKHFITRMGLFITSWKVVSRREIQKTRLQEGLKKILPYFTFDGAPLKGYYHSEP